MGKMRVLVYVCILAIGLLCVDSNDNIAGTEPTRVLLISSYHPGFPTFFQQVHGVTSILSTKGILLDVEFMDKKRFADDENESLFLELLSFKIHRTRPYDVVMTADDDALLFMLKHRQNLFPAQPLVFFGVNDIAGARELNGRAGITGVIEAVSMKETVRMMLDLLPKTEKVLALVDTTPSSVGDVSTFRTLSAAFPQVAFSELSLGDHSFKEFAKALQEIDNKTAVLLLSAYVDKEAARMLFGDSLRLILDNLRQPVFHLWYHGMGDGMIGGKVISHEQQGKAAAELVLRILTGEPAESIRVIEESPNITIVDYNVLKKFGLEKNKIVNEAIVLNNPFSFYKRYKYHLLIGIIFLLSQTFIILYLFFMVRKNKKIENSLRESEGNLKAVFETASIGVAQADPYTGILVRVNQKMSDITGYSSDELLVMRIPEITHSEDRDRDWDAFQNVVSNRANDCRLEKRYIRKDSTIAWVSVNMTVIRDGAGHPLRTVSMVEDISERKRAEEKIRESETRLRESEHHFRTLANSGLALIWTSGLNGLCNYFNESWLRYTGRTLAQELGNGWTEGVHPEDFECCLSIYVSHFDRREPFSMEYRLRKANGEYGWILDSGNPRYDSGGNFDGYIGYCYDITDRKHAEEEKRILNSQLQQAQKLEAIGTLAGGIAHDFNNILGAIVGYAEMVRDDLPRGSRGIHDIDQVLKASYRAKDLVKQILAFSRQGEYQKIPIQPSAILKEAIALLRPSLPMTITIKQDIDPDTGMVLADPTQIHQVVMNICTNAFQSMEVNGGKLTISLKKKNLSQSDLATEPDLQPGMYVQLSIRDTGEGIPQDIREKIFDPFFTTKDVGKGTGLGLSTVYSIVKSCNGSIVCDSQLGKGTEFRILLPALEGHAVQENGSTDLTPRGKEHILFIDDEEMLIELGQTVLQRLGYHVTTKRNSLDALTAFQNQPDSFDLIITDQTMPGMTGINLARRIRQIRPHMPIILCTGYSSLIDHDKAKAAGINGFAFKPLTKKVIGELIRNVLGEGGA